MSDSLKNSAYVYDSIANDSFDPFQFPPDVSISGTVTAGQIVTGSINVSGTANISNFEISSLPRLNVAGVSNLVTLFSATSSIDTLYVSNILIQGNTFNVAQNILTSNSITIVNYGTGPALNVTQASGTPDQLIAYFTALDDHPALKILGTGQVLLNYIDGALFSNTELEVNGNVYISNNLNVGSLNSLGTSNLANIMSTNVTTITLTGTGLHGSSLNVTGTSNLANLVSTNVITGTLTGTGIYGSSLNVSGTSNLANLVSTNVSTGTLTGTGIYGSSLNVSGTSNLANIITNNLLATTSIQLNTPVTFPISYPVVLGGALSDESTTLTTGTKLTFRAPFSFTISSDIPPLFTLNANSASSNVTFSILKNGSNIYSVNPNVSSVSTFLSSNATPGTLLGGSNTFAYLDKIDVTIVGIGSGTPSGAKCTIYCD